VTRPLVASLCVLAAIAFFGVSRLPDGLGPDQALFLVGARSMSAGGVPYRDFWDVTPIGSFLFYLAAGRLFGFTDLGVHLFELLYMLLFAVSLIVALGRTFGSRTGCVAALVTVGGYYLVGDEWWMTTSGILATFPTFVVLAALALAAEHPDQTRWLAVAGLAAGGVFLFKPVLFAIPLAICLCWAVVMSRRVTRAHWIVLAGFTLLPVAGLIVWFARHGALRLLVDTMITTPAEIARTVVLGDRLPILRASIKWLIVNLAFVLFLAGAGLYRSWTVTRVSHDRADRRELFVPLALVVWVVTATGVILVQVWSWWVSHWLILLVPLGVLGALAFQRDRSGVPARPSPRWPIVVVTLLLAYPLERNAWDIVKGFPASLAALRADQRPAYQSARVTWYAERQADLSFLTEPGRRPGALFAWGNPYIYLADGTRALGSTILAPPMVTTPALYARMLSELEKTAPVYIYLKRRPHEAAFLAAPDRRAFLDDHYDVARRSPYGTWFQRRD